MSYMLRAPGEVITYYDGEDRMLGEGYYWAAGSYASICIQVGLQWIEYLIKSE